MILGSSVVANLEIVGELQLTLDSKHIGTKQKNVSTYFGDMNK